MGISAISTKHYMPSISLATTIASMMFSSSTSLSQGRFAGLNVRKQTVDIMQRMGISAIRCGGSFASVTAWPDGGGGTPPSNVSGEWYQWQKWTGPVWNRPSIGAVWNAYSGNSYSLIGGWGALLRLFSHATGLSKSASQYASLLSILHSSNQQ